MWSVIMHLLVTKDNFANTVIKQWWDIDVTVMQQWSNSDAFELGSSDAFDLSFLTLFSSFSDVIDQILSFCNALEVWLLIWWWNKTF
jgi:hypothetical protein